MSDLGWSHTKSGGKRGGGLAQTNDYKRSNWDASSPTKEYFDEIIRVSKHQIIFGANHFIDKIPYPSSCWIVWDKDNTGNFADSELAYTNFKTAVRNYKFRWNGMLQQDMKNKEKRYHPTQKPVELFKMILRDYAIKNNLKTIFDPFIGSGTTAISCKSLGIDFVGCELDTDYCEIANKRLQNVQGVLF
jgi:site-specific DNA-methyltransferase (adenine-specific)